MNLIKLIKSRVWIGLLLLVLNCRPLTDKPPANLIPKETMVEILTDIHLAEARVSKLALGSSDSSAIVYRRLERDIFKKHKVDTAAYNQSYTYYSAQPKLMEEIYKQVVENLQETKPDSTAKAM
ncbi:hypothetical protein GCM10023187_24640 [Nibrella viscosa]|uniref:DUF4296 domain-containing protein n=1 Tax=Nibrella viscosa TaxID=1084524 RepID=A0ABP8KGC9_9BACT